MQPAPMKPNWRERRTMRPKASQSPKAATLAMKPSGIMPAARAAKIICCLGMSSVSSVGSMPVSSAKSSPPMFIAARRALDCAIAGIWKKAAGVSIMAISRVWPGRSPRFASRPEMQLVDALHVLGALRLGDRDAVDVRADRGFEVLHRDFVGTVDAHHDVGAAAPHALRRRRHQLARRVLLRGRHAVLEIELDAVGAARVRLVDVLLDVDRDVQQRAPDGKIRFHSADDAFFFQQFFVFRTFKPRDFNNSRLCWPSFGAGVRIEPGVPEQARHHVVHREGAHLGVGIVGEQLALDDVRILEDLRDVVDRADGDLGLLEERDVLGLRAPATKAPMIASSSSACFTRSALVR